MSFERVSSPKSVESHPALRNLEFHSIKAITLDVGGTLIEPWPSVGKVYASCARECGLGDIPEAVLEERFHQAWKMKTKFEYGLHEWRIIVGQCFEPYCPPEKMDRIFEAAYLAFTKPEAWSVFSDVFPTLRVLKKAGIRLAAISNWDERLPALLDQLKLSEYFDFMMVSGIEKCHKPDIRLFQKACERLQVEPEHTLHVGDHPVEDIQGCRNAGMHGLLLQRSEKTSHELALTDLIPLQTLTQTA